MSYASIESRVKNVRCWKTRIGNWALCLTYHERKDWLPRTESEIAVKRGVIWIDLIAFVFSAVREKA